MGNLENLYDWLFHFNSFEGMWSAFKREDKEKYFNGELPKNAVIKNNDVMVLIEYITKSNKS